MKRFKIALLGLFLLSSLMGPAHADSDLNFNDEFTFNELTFQDDVINAPAPLSKGCIAAYEKREKKLKKNSIILPLLVIPAMAVTSLGGMQIGALVTMGGESATPTILASSMGFALGFYITPIIAAGVETVQVIKYFDVRRMIGLIREAEATPPQLNGPHTSRMRRKLESWGVLMSAENLHAKVIARNESGELCDGSLTDQMNAKKEKKKLVGFHQFVKILAHSSSQLKREDEKQIFMQAKTN